MIELTAENYFSKEAMNDYWSVSQFKQFCKCPARAIAEMNGEYQRETSTALLVGSYVDAYFTGDKGALGRFALGHPEIFNSRTGALKSDFKHAETMIRAVERQPLMMKYLMGENQVIMSEEVFDVPWKIKIDVHCGDKIVDLKTVKDFDDVYESGFGYRPWIEYGRYLSEGGAALLRTHRTTAVLHCSGNEREGSGCCGHPHSAACTGHGSERSRSKDR